MLFPLLSLPVRRSFSHPVRSSWAEETQTLFFTVPGWLLQQGDLDPSWAKGVRCTIEHWAPIGRNNNTTPNQTLPTSVWSRESCPGCAPASSQCSSVNTIYVVCVYNQSTPCSSVIPLLVPPTTLVVTGTKLWGGCCSITLYTCNFLVYMSRELL